MNTALSIKQQKAHKTWDRNREIRQLKSQGMKQVLIAQYYHISEARVSQILKFKADKEPSLFRPRRLFERLLNLFGGE